MENKAAPLDTAAEPSHIRDNRSRLSVLAEKLPRGTRVDLDRLLTAELADPGLGDKLGDVAFRMRLKSLAPCWAGSLCMGTALGYSLPAGRSLGLARSQGTLEITHRQIFWVGSLVTLGAVFGSLGGALLTQRCGRRWSLVVAALGLFASWMAVVWARHLYEFLVARFVNGLFTGLVSLVVPAHIAEMAVVSDRGTDGALHQLAITLGMLYAYVIGRFLDWAWLAVCCALPSALLLLPAVWLLVESPRWLLQRGEGQRARQALIGVRTAKSQAEVEFDATQAIFPRYRTPLPHYFLALLVMVTQQMSGVNSIIISTTSIEPGPEFSLESMDNIVMLALLQSVATAGAVPFVDLAGRRRALGLSVLVCSISLVSLAVIYFHAVEPPAGDDKTTWMVPKDETTEVATATSRELDNPLIFVLKGVFVAGFSAGLGPVPWILAAELTPLRGTGLEFGTVCAANWAGSFVTANVFAITATTKMLAVSLWVYSGITITGGLVIFALLPETTSMSIEEILLLGNDEQAAKKKNKKTKEVLDAADRAPLSSKKEDAAPASLPPAPAEQERPAEAELVSKASEKQIAAAEKLQPRRPGSRSPSVASRRSTASKASRASRQQAERASKKDSQ